MNTDSRAFNVIEEPIIRFELTSGARERWTLPQVFAALAGDRIETFPALRPHQSPAWHAFLVQIAAMGLETLGRTEPLGDDEAGWSEVLRALTPEWPADEPWCLVTPPGCPALLQAPVPETDPRKYEKEFKNRVLAQDALDMLATAKNHDLKADLAHRSTLARGDCRSTRGPGVPDRRSCRPAAHGAGWAFRPCRDCRRAAVRGGERRP